MALNSLEKITELSLLYDFYGALLTKRQQDVTELYYGENYSIVEIAEELNITKQGVHEALKKSEELLRNYEEKLGLIKKLRESGQAIEEIDKKISELEALELPGEATEKLEDIRKIIDKLED